jgi:hypothetical protein
MSIGPNPLNDISRVYLEAVAAKPDFLDLDKDGNKKEPMKKAAKEVEAPKERLKTDRNMFNIPKGEQQAAKERLLAKARAKRAKMDEEVVTEKKGDGNLANNYPPYDKVTRGDVIAGALGKDQMGGKKKKVKESSDYDPMDDDEFDHDEAEENRGVSGKNNPKGGKSLGKKKKSVKEGFSNWREDLTEVMTDIEDNKKVEEKKVNNKIKINPKLGEAIEAIGGTLIEMVEIGEGFVDPEEGEAPSGRRPLDNVIDHPNKNVRKKAIKGMKKQMAKEYGGKWSSKSDDPNESYELEGELVDENVATGKARRAKFGGVSQRVGKSEVVTNKEKSAALEKHFAAKKAKEKSAGEAAHKAASAKGLSPAEAEMRRKAAERKAARMRKEEVEQVDEKLNLKKEKMGDVIKDFYKSDAPQFKGRSKEKRRQMAIAAKLTAERGGRKLGEQVGVEPSTDPKKEMMDKQKLANMKMLQMRKQQLERKKLQMQKQGKLPLEAD